MKRERPSRGIRTDRSPATSSQGSTAGRKAHVDVLLDEVERAEVLDENPAGSALWTHAPWGLRRQYADGRCDRETFWLRLRVWLEFQQRSAA